MAYAMAKIDLPNMMGILWNSMFKGFYKGDIDMKLLDFPKEFLELSCFLGDRDVFGGNYRSLLSNLAEDLFDIFNSRSLTFERPVVVPCNSPNKILALLLHPFRREREGFDNSSKALIPGAGVILGIGFTFECLNTKSKLDVISLGLQLVFFEGRMPLVAFPIGCGRSDVGLA
ncbi:hypothetical protein Tco_1431224 [Tanacetum coccineum]